MKEFAVSWKAQQIMSWSQVTSVAGCCLHKSLVFPWPRRVYGGSCKTCPFVMLPTVKIGGSLVRNAGFSASTCLVSSRWFSCGVAVSMREAGKPLLFECFQAGCHVVLRGRRGTFWHSNLFDDVHKISKLEEVLVGNAGFSATTCIVASLSFSCGVAVSMGEAGKTCKTAMIKGLLS